MAKKVLIFLVGIAALATAAGTAYFYSRLAPPAGLGTLPPAAQPDNSVVAGPIKAVSGTSITVIKQNGATATLSIVSTTQVSQAGQSGQAPTPKKAGDLAAGMMVLVSPSPANASVAGSVVVIPPPPAQ